LLCDGAALVAVDLEGGNACGGCDPLLGEPGSECGACGGVWTCDAEGGVRCIGGSANACGGCAALDAGPGRDCDAGGNAGVTVCISLEETTCVPPGSTNACGGLGTITGDPLGQSCGACADGVVACDATDALRRSTVCEGASDLNSCGGCGLLDGTVGSACGTCGSGSYACSATNLVCINDAGAAAENVCGGCSTLAADPGDPCGRCGTWACDPSATGRLACAEPAGGCGTVAVCGNGAVEAGEGCDDGNTVTEECAYADLACTVCSASCQSVPGAASFCGDGLLDAAEVCDAGSANGSGACSVGCTCSAGYHLEGGVCTSDERACSVTNGTGSETWTGSSYGACVAVSCLSGYYIADGSCALNAARNWGLEASCRDGVDDDADGLTDCDDGDCIFVASCPSPVNSPGENCANGSDDDSDVAIDCDDSECQTAANCLPTGTAGTCAEPFALRGFGHYNVPPSAADRQSTSCGPLAGGDRVIAFTSPVSGPICFTALGSTDDLALEVRTTCNSTASTVACDDDSIGLDPVVGLTAVAGTTYYIIFDASSPGIDAWAFYNYLGPCN
jgi:hypothetical protein